MYWTLLLWESSVEKDQKWTRNVQFKLHMSGVNKCPRGFVYDDDDDDNNK